jgi:hypothetical protein
LDDSRKSTTSTFGTTAGVVLEEANTTLCARFVGGRGTVSHERNAVSDGFAFNASRSSLVEGILASAGSTALVSIGGSGTRARGGECGRSDTTGTFGASSGRLEEVDVASCANNIGIRSTVSAGAVGDSRTFNTSSTWAKVKRVLASGSSSASVSVALGKSSARLINNFRRNTHITRCASSCGVDEEALATLGASLISSRGTMSHVLDTVGDTCTFNTSTRSFEERILATSLTGFNGDFSSHGRMNLANVPQLTTALLRNQHVCSDVEGQRGIVRVKDSDRRRIGGNLHCTRSSSGTLINGEFVGTHGGNGEHNGVTNLDEKLGIGSSSCARESPISCVQSCNSKGTLCERYIKQSDESKKSYVHYCCF